MVCEISALMFGNDIDHMICYSNLGSNDYGYTAPVQDNTGGARPSASSAVSRLRTDLLCERCTAPPCRESTKSFIRETRASVRLSPVLKVQQEYVFTF